MKKKEKKEIDARGASRRKFLGKVGAATAAVAAASVGVLGSSPKVLAQADGVIGSAGGSGNADGRGSRGRIQEARVIRISAANRDAALRVPPHTTNGDEQVTAALDQPEHCAALTTPRQQ